MSLINISRLLHLFLLLFQSITDANLTVSMVYDKLFHSAKFLEFMAFESKKAGDPLDYRYTYLNNSDAVQFNYRQFFFYALLDDVTHCPLN